MENLKFIIFSIIIIVLLGLGSYWAFSTLESGSSHVDIQKQKELESKNEELLKEVDDLKKQVSLLQADKEQILVEKEQKEITEQKVEEPVVTPTTTKTTTPVKTTTYKYQTLINELQKLIDNKTYLKLKSQGTAVGTVQKFLNLYNNTSTKVDNDYGVSTVTAVKNYQKAVGLTADGATGSSTYQKMITWLKSR